MIIRFGILGACMMVGFVATHANAQVTASEQAQLAGQLGEVNAYERGGVLGRIGQIRPENLTPQLRSALIRALEREAQIFALPPGSVPGSIESGELTLMLGDLVAPLRDPRSIRGLAGALGASKAARSALAEFGETAAPAVIAVVGTTQSISIENSALLTLRYMVEGVGGELRRETLDRIRRIAEKRLRFPQKSFVTVLWAIDLAKALGDAELLRIVETLAMDRNAIVALGVTDPRQLAETQRYAADRLAGGPPDIPYKTVVELTRRH